MYSTSLKKLKRKHFAVQRNSSYPNAYSNFPYIWKSKFKTKWGNEHHREPIGISITAIIGIKIFIVIKTRLMIYCIISMIGKECHFILLLIYVRSILAHQYLTHYHKSTADAFHLWSCCLKRQFLSTPA